MISMSARLPIALVEKASSHKYCFLAHWCLRKSATGWVSYMNVNQIAL